MPFSSAGEELFLVAHEEDEEDHDGHHPLHVGPQAFGEAHALALVGLGQEVVPTPAALADAEEQVDERAQGQEVVA